MSRKAHEELCEAAKEAIDSVFGDTSVSKSDTIISLRDIVEHAEGMIHGLELEVREEGGE